MALLSSVYTVSVNKKEASLKMSNSEREIVPYAR